MPFDDKLILEIMVSGATTADAGGTAQWHNILPEDFVYYLEDSYLCPSTDVAVHTGNTQSYTLVDEDDNTIATIAAGSALSVGGTAFASLSSTYREVDCSAGKKSVYLKMNLSGSGIAPKDTLRVIMRWSVRRPGTAA